MGENTLTSVGALKARRRHPVRRARDSRAHARARCESDPQAVAASRRRRGGNMSRGGGKEAFTKVFVVRETAGCQHDAVARSNSPGAGSIHDLHSSNRIAFDQQMLNRRTEQ